MFHIGAHANSQEDEAHVKSSMLSNFPKALSKHVSSVQPVHSLTCFCLGIADTAAVMSLQVQDDEGQCLCMQSIVLLWYAAFF